MISYFASANYLLAACSKQDYLIVQFILSEFFDACKHVNHIETSAKELWLDVAPPNTRRVNKLLKQIIFDLETLSGCALTSALPWNIKPGIFGRIEMYSHAACCEDEEKWKYLQNAIIKILITSRSALLNTKNYNEKELQTQLKNLTMQMKKITILMAKIVSTFKKNENVMLFMLRYSERLKDLPDPKSFTRIIKYVSHGIMSEKYKIRGFETILPFIDRYFSKVKKQQT